MSLYLYYIGKYLRSIFEGVKQVRMVDLSRTIVSAIVDMSYLLIKDLLIINKINLLPALYFPFSYRCRVSLKRKDCNEIFRWWGYLFIP